MIIVLVQILLQREADAGSIKAWRRKEMETVCSNGKTLQRFKNITSGREDKGEKWKRIEEEEVKKEALIKTNKSLIISWLYIY